MKQVIFLITLGVMSNYCIAQTELGRSKKQTALLIQAGLFIFYLLHRSTQKSTFQRVTFCYQHIEK